MRAFRYASAAALALACSRAWTESPGPASPFEWGLDLRWRYEEVDQGGFIEPADASTLRIRARAATDPHAAFSGLVEVDHVAAVGARAFNDTRNGETGYPVIADPEGTDLNQAWVQFAPRPDAWVRIGRQRVNLDNLRFVGSVDWRQNEQTLDALRIDAKILRRITVDYTFVDRVNRVFGPDPGTPAADFTGASHLINARTAMPAAGTLVAYAYLLDFDDAPALKTDTLGIRYEGMHSIRGGLSLAWNLEYARQQDASGNPIDIDAFYALVDLHVKISDFEILAGREVLSGVRVNPDPSASPAFQTPLATLHKFQGWADKFLTTPSPGVEDSYLGAQFSKRGWRLQAAWHVFDAEATGLRYGTELDALVALKFATRYEFLLKLADYRADEGFTDTRKLWAQVGASF